MKFNKLNLSHCISFYISEVSEVFFESINQHPSRDFVNNILQKIKTTLSEEELEKLNSIEEVTKDEKIVIMLNHVLKKIVSKTGSSKCDLFNVIKQDRFNSPVYIQSINAFENNLINNEFAERRYDYLIEVNKNSYLKKFVNSIRISFFLDLRAQILSGSFTLNLVNKSIEKQKKTEIFKDIFVNALVKHFICNQLYPISLNSFIFDSENPSNKLALKERIKLLKTNWNSLFFDKFYNCLNNKNKQQLQETSDEMFYAVINTYLIMLISVEELRVYFTSKEPALILKVLDKKNTLREDPDQNPETDLYELIQFIEQNYLKKDKKTSWNKKKVQDLEQLLEEINKINLETKNESLAYPDEITELEIDNDNFVSTKQVFRNQLELQLLHGIVINPEKYGIGMWSSYFADWSEYKNLIEQMLNPKSGNDFYQFEKDIDESICQINKKYLTFISSDSNTFLIVKNDDVKVISNYVWAQLFFETRRWIINDIEFDLYEKGFDKSHFSRNIALLESLSFSWLDPFYGLTSIKEIMQKIDSKSNLKTSIEEMVNRFKHEQRINKKDNERVLMIFAYIAAFVVGFINFFSMVFTILTVSDLNAGLTVPNIIVISIASVLAFILIVIAVLFRFKWKHIKH
ncbi:MPN338 family protein [Mycoplasmoides genitalium]|uniref:Uncharacterized protein MG242 n=1 Tax=Mycoplasma genitalium (strain ATCC 33530 / DSM 19775 / NCTC 10195 / G37) TaxID=243273 RepID=Y242_MYCGE|nr:hypothetical protein [Mycoplasmoides genitalium]P47484.1 RecName: Full=Uncharacterized protein MG242 [Mycoplasmoides genitalium G37]ABY79395.1 expressed protein of unknown function [synthetic Mycoplasma genitalium JCVI-1.0]AAC71463.1 expressed protein of unknown function [Mycoplasmoides genitalium G37]AFQ03073.1 hypothetical protein CM9_01430 [Mycoplasmoides genitalium M2321]AFQ04565.1 hypothetical protein CM5_01410 [Mycoplasmoides genitalium M2288]